MRAVFHLWITTSLSARDAAVQLVVAVVYLGFEHEPGVVLVVAGEDLVEGFEHLVVGDVGEESQATAVDPEHAHVRSRQLARRVQQGAVAADDDDQVAAWRPMSCREALSTPSM